MNIIYRIAREKPTRSVALVLTGLQVLVYALLAFPILYVKYHRIDGGVIVYFVHWLYLIPGVMISTFVCIAYSIRLFLSRISIASGVILLSIAVIPISTLVAIQLSDIIREQQEKKPAIAKYRELNSYFKSPRILLSVYKHDATFALVFEDSITVLFRPYGSSPNGFTKFCNDKLIGQKLKVILPDSVLFVAYYRDGEVVEPNHVYWGGRDLRQYYRYNN